MTDVQFFLVLLTVSASLSQSPWIHVEINVGDTNIDFNFFSGNSTVGDTHYHGVITSSAPIESFEIETSTSTQEI